MYKSYDTINSVASCYRVTKGLAEDRYAVMDRFLCAEIEANNAEYKADTGININ